MLSLQAAWGRRTQTDKQHKDETCALSETVFWFHKKNNFNGED